jgi:predicted XRE-type DNA-binding protein
MTCKLFPSPEDRLLAFSFTSGVQPCYGWNMDTSAKNLVEDLRALVEQQGCSRYSIAQYLGIHRSRLTGWLKDGRIPNGEHALLVADFLRKMKRREQRARKKAKLIVRLPVSTAASARAPVQGVPEAQ